jgi:hypothetical protein
MINFIMSSNPVPLVANFVPNPFISAAGSYLGVFLNTNDARAESSGLINLQLTPAGLFTGKATIAGQTFPFKGHLDVNGMTTVAVLRPSEAPIVLGLHLELAVDSHPLTGLVTNVLGTNVLVSNLYAEKNVFNARSNPAPSAGLHRFELRRLSDHASFGLGFGTVSSSGSVRVIGQFAGRPFTFNSILFRDSFEAGNVPFYVSLGPGGEAIVGLLFLGEDSLNTTGQLTWVTPAGLATPLEVAPF